MLLPEIDKWFRLSHMLHRSVRLDQSVEPTDSDSNAAEIKQMSRTLAHAYFTVNVSPATVTEQCIGKLASQYTSTNLEHRCRCCRCSNYC